jgi:hypothetical protein
LSDEAIRNVFDSVRGDAFVLAAKVAKAIDRLERRACTCLPKIRCLRCELLELLGSRPARGTTAPRPVLPRR